MSTTVTSDPAPALSQRQIMVVFVTIVLGILLAALDQTVVSTALPTIVGDLGGAGHVSWVVTSYILTQTIATVLAGKLGDLLGRKAGLPGQHRGVPRGVRRCAGISGSLTDVDPLACAAGHRRRRVDRDGHRPDR